MYDPDLFRRFLARENGSGLAQQVDENGGNRLVNQVTDAYAQAGQVVPDNLQGPMRELNDLTQREAELAGAGAGALAYLGADGYDPLTVRRRANALTDYIYQNSAEARNLKDKLAIDDARQKIQSAELQNQYDQRTLDDRVANIALDRRASEIDVKTAENNFAQAEEQRAMLDYANKNSITLDQMRTALDDGSSNAMMAAFGSTNRLSALGLYKLMSDTETGKMQSEYNRGAQVITMDAQRFEKEGYTLEQAQQMLAGDIPIPQGYTRAAINQAKENLTSTSAAMHDLMAMEAQGITDQKQLEQLYTSAMTTEQLTTVANGIAAMPEKPKDGMVEMTMPNGTPVKISVTSIMDALTTRQTLDMQRAATKLSDDYQYQVFLRQAQEANKQTQLALKLSGIVVPQALQTQMQTATLAAQGKFQLSLREADPVKRAAMQQEANTIMNNTTNLVVDYLKQSGVPDYITEDLANGKFMSNQSYRSALASSLGFGVTGMGQSPLGGVVAQTLAAGNQNWFTGGKFSKEGFTKLMTPDKDGNYSPIEDLGLDMKVFDQSMSNFFVNIQAEAYLNKIVGNEQLMKMMPDQTRAALMQLATGKDANGGQIAGLEAMQPGDRIKRISDVLMASDSLATNLRASGDQRYANYAPGYFMRQLQNYMQDTGAIQQALNAPDGVPDRETAALLNLWLSYRNGYDVSGQNSLPYQDIVPTVARTVANATGANMAGRIYDTADGGGNPNGVNNAAWNTAVTYMFNDANKPMDYDSAMPLFRAAAASIMIRRLATEPMTTPAFWRIGVTTTGLPLTANYNQIADPDEVMAETAKMLGITPAELEQRLAGK